MKTVNNDVLVLLSGGPDSAVAAYLYHENGYKIHCLTVVNKQRGSNCVEVECAKSIALKVNAQHTLIDFSCLAEIFRDIPGMKFAVGGNVGHCCPPKINTAPLSVESMHLSAMMYAVAHNIRTVVWSVHRDDFNDLKSLTEVREYFSILENLVRLRTKHLCKIETPFLNLRKSDVLLLGNKIGAPFDKTFSCAVNEEAVHCGECDQCIKRIKSFREAGIVDSARFITHKMRFAA